MIGAALERTSFLRRIVAMELAFRRRGFRPDLWARGFFSQRAWLYDFARFGHRWYLTDWEIERRLGRVNGDAGVRWVEDKLLFHLWLDRLGLSHHAAGLVGVTGQGRFVGMAGHATLADAFDGGEPLVCKPVRGNGGRGVTLVRSPEEVPKDGSVLLERRLVPHPYAERIFPGALNTIRIITMLDADGPFIAGAAHRFGIAAAAPVDNFKRGGVSALVDPDSGRLSAGRSNPGHHPDHVHPIHPETGAAIEGVRVPYWGEAKRLALELAGLVPGLWHVGWDIAITPDGPRVVEGNSQLANPNLVQAHQPLLQDPRVRAFLWRHKVLSDRRYRRLQGMGGAPRGGWVDPGFG